MGRLASYGPSILLGILAISSPSEARIYGACRFDSVSLQFTGSVSETAACLLRKVRPRGSGADAQPIPAWLTARLTQKVPFSVKQLRAYMHERGIPVSSLSSDLRLGDVPAVRYFVIHDTSSPEIATGSTSFPADIDLPGYAGNRLTGWLDTAQRVNLIINRVGESRELRRWGAVRPLAATKLERERDVPEARRLFVHVENIQPRLKPPGSWAWRAPNPGLSKPQEERLALAYVVASMQAGRWLIPAYHFNIDEGFADVHDDPQNMDLASWVGQIETITREITTGTPT